MLDNSLRPLIADYQQAVARSNSGNFENGIGIESGSTTPPGTVVAAHERDRL